MIAGGTVEPCVPWHHIAYMQRGRTPRLCPRVPLLPGNEIAARLAEAMIRHGGDGVMLGKVIECETAGLAPHEVAEIIQRCILAISAPFVSSRIEALRKGNA